MMKSDDTLAMILVAQVLTLANQLKTRAEAGGTTSTSDYTEEAARLIREKRVKVFQALAER